MKNHQLNSYNYRILETIYPGFNDYSEYIPFKNGIIMDFHDKKGTYDIKIIEIDEYGNARLLDDDDQIIWN